MEENNNYVFQGKVGQTNCKIDKQLWQFEEDDATLTIPIKSVSNVVLTKQYSLWWLLVIILGGIIGVFVYNSSVSGYETDLTLFYIIVVVTVILAVLVLFLTRKYALKVIPHSGISYSVATRKKGLFQELYDAMLKTLRCNL